MSNNYKVKQPDSYYLQNEIIAQIFKGNDRGMINRVFIVIEKKYRRIFMSRAELFRHYLLSEQVLVGIAQEAFNEALEIFYIHVRSGKFQVEGSDFENYLFRLFKNQYSNYYRKEMVNKKHTARMQKNSALYAEMSKDNPAINKPEGIYYTVRMAIHKLKPACQDLMTLKFLQNKGADEMVEITKLKSKHSVSQQASLCREHLKNILTREFGIEC